MATGAVVVTHRCLAPGVVAFAWTAGDDRGDGLLVDVAVASARWCEVADVLVRGPVTWGTGDWAAVLPAVVARYRAVLARAVRASSAT
ncbi:hypothetical protein [Actinophytocola sp. KF-1]